MTQDKILAAADRVAAWPSLPDIGDGRTVTTFWGYRDDQLPEDAAALAAFARSLPPAVWEAITGNWNLACQLAGHHPDGGE